MFEGIENTFFWAQVVGLCAMTISILAWQIKNPRHIILLYVPGATLWGIQYLLLGAPIGVLTNFSSAIKDTFVVFVPDRYLKMIISVFICFIITTGLYLFEAWYDALPLIAMTILNLALLQRDNRALISRTMILGQICWFFYNCIVGSWMGSICSLLVGTSSIIGMARHEAWEIGKCRRTFFSSLARSLFVFPNFRTFP